LVGGLTGLVLTGDLFNMFVWFEVMLISSFVLLALGGGRQQLQAALKYVTLNLLSSVLFLTAIGLLYGLTGTLNIAELALRVPEVEHQKLLTAVAVLFLCAFGIKAGMVPFFFWVPAAYVAPPAAVTALFAALLTKVGVYAVIRVFGLLFMHDADEMTVLYTVLLWLSGITMVLGVLGAASQPVVRRILAFHSVSQVGYMLMGPAVAGLALASALRSDGAEAEAARTAATIVLAGSVLFMIHHAVVKMSLFMVAGLMIAKCGSDDLRRVAGLYRRDWLLGL
jgi:multicomponent Na+:H+ antiporter subunit D